MYGIARSVPNRYSGKLIARKKSDPVQYRNSGTRTKHAKSWLDAAFGELLRQVEYKARWNSKHFVQVGRFFPSTKLCSACGYKNDDLSLSEREWTCLGCGTHHLRDLNVAKNVRVDGLKIVAEGHPET